MPNRRAVLGLLAAAPLAAACAPNAAPDAAAAWRSPGAGEQDLRRFALAHAILAPNPHNRQPWLVDLIGEDELVLSVDVERLLPATDPFNRQITLGCGCFLELFDLATRARGVRADITLWPEGEPQPVLDTRPVAHIRLTREAVSPDPLFEQIVARRTNREPYAARVVATAALDAMREAAGNAMTFGSATGGALRESLRRLAWDAFLTEVRTEPAYMESVELMRIGAAEAARYRDGIVLDGPMIEFARTIGLINRGVLADIDNPLTKSGYEAFRPLALEAPAFAWIASTDNTRTTQIAAGRAYARMALAATSQGVSIHPWSQALQEYPEMTDLLVEAERVMNAPSEGRVQMFVRAGYGPIVNPAPRRGLAEHLRA